MTPLTISFHQRKKSCFSLKTLLFIYMLHVKWFNVLLCVHVLQIHV